MADGNVKIGYFLSAEEATPLELVERGRQAEQAGFAALWISDHFHPWNDEQGQSPFVWSVLGALSQVCSLPVTTAVTCPTMRMHPVVVAQAAATSAVLTEGRFTLGVGSGEALNEQVIGAGWPLADQRLEMLEEAVEVMRRLWSGEVVTHRGRHYTVEHARLYTLPDVPPQVYVSAFGPKALEVAARIGDGFISTSPDADSVRRFDELTGGGRPKQAGFKVCYDSDEKRALETAHRLWPNSGLSGELSQVLRTPEHFMQASSSVTPEQVGEAIVCSSDPQRHLDKIQEYADAGFDEVYVSQVGPDQEPFFSFYATEVLPRFG